MCDNNNINNNNNNIIKNNFPQKLSYVVWKTFSFIPDEANVDDLAKVCA